jgi:hypothetical protein
MGKPKNSKKADKAEKAAKAKKAAQAAKNDAVATTVATAGTVATSVATSPTSSVATSVANPGSVASTSTSVAMPVANPGSVASTSSVAKSVANPGSVAPTSGANSWQGFRPQGVAANQTECTITASASSASIASQSSGKSASTLAVVAHQAQAMASAVQQKINLLISPAGSKTPRGAGGQSKSEGESKRTPLTIPLKAKNKSQKTPPRGLEAVVHASICNSPGRTILQKVTNAKKSMKGAVEIDMFAVPETGGNIPQPRHKDSANAAGSFAGKQQPALPKYQPTHQSMPSMPTIESTSDVGSGVMSIDGQSTEDEVEGNQNPDPIASAATLLADNLKQWSSENLQKLNEQVKEQLPNTRWADDVEAEEERRRRDPLNLAQVDGEPSEKGESEEEDEDEVVTVGESSSDEEEQLDYLSFWDIHEDDPPAIRALKVRFTQMCRAQLAKCSTDEERHKCVEQHNALFEQSMRDHFLRGEKIPRYEKFWSAVAMAEAEKPKKSSGSPRIDVTARHAGDDDDTMVGQTVDPFLATVYQMYHQQKGLPKPKSQTWGRFMARRLDVENKQAHRNFRRPLTLRERHLFHIIRCKEPVNKDGTPADPQTWVAEILSLWQEPRDYLFQMHVDKMSWEVFDGETYVVDPKVPGRSRSTSSLGSAKGEEPDTPTKIAAKDVLPPLEDYDETIEQDVEMVTSDEPQQQTRASEAFSSEDTRSDKEKASEDAEVERWLKQVGFRCSRSLFSGDDSVTDQYPVPTFYTPEMWRSFEDYRNGTNRSLWLKIPIPNNAGNSKCKTSFSQNVWIDHTGQYVQFEGIGDGPVHRELAEKIMRYYSLPGLPTVDVRLLGAQLSADVVANAERLDYWAKDPAAFIPPFERHNMAEYELPPAAYILHVAKKTFATVEIPYGDRDLKGMEPTDKDLVPIYGSTIADCLQGLTRFRFKAWEPSQVRNGKTYPPLVRDFVGRPSVRQPSLGDLSADWAIAFQRRVTAVKDLPADVKALAVQKNMADDKKYTFWVDGKGLWYVNWKEKAKKGQDKPKNVVESFITAKSRPFGDKPFQKVIDDWEKGADPDLLAWWTEHKVLSAPDGTPYARDVKRWFDEWSTTVNFPIPKCPAVPQRLTPNQRALYCMKLSLWWESGVYPWTNKANASEWQINLWENLSKNFHAHKIFYFIHQREEKKRLAAVTKAAAKVKLGGAKSTPQAPQKAAASSRSRSPTGTPPPSPVLAGSHTPVKASQPAPKPAPSGSGVAKAKASSSAPGKAKATSAPQPPKPGAIPSLHSGKTWAARASVDEDAERAKCRTILDDNELYLMYRTVELGLEPNFPCNIEDAKLRPADNEGEVRSNVLFFFTEGDDRKEILPSEASVIQQQITSYLTQQMLDDNISLDTDHVNITDIKFREESGALMIKCGNQKTAIFLGLRINDMIHPFRLRLWESERDERYKFTFFLPASAGHLPRESYLKVLRKSNPGYFDWVEPPKEGYRPVAKYQTFEVTATESQAKMIEAKGKIFRFGIDYGYIRPFGADKPRCTLQGGAEIYRGALTVWDGPDHGGGGRRGQETCSGSRSG